MALFPPIVASSMPAFDITQNKVRIYYTLSSYNAAKKSDIAAVHVSVRRQSSNVNVLKNANEIVQKSFGQQQDIDKTLNRYYVEITSDDLSEAFQVDALYKVQLRFSSIAGNSSASFFTDNIDNFSEWSTVCIIKPINAPLFYIQDFYTGRDPQQDDQNNFYYSLADFVGVYKQKESSQILRYWRLRLLDSAYNAEQNLLDIDKFTLADSGKTLNSSSNYNIGDGSVVISCSLPYELKKGQRYKLLFQIETRNGYENSVLYSFDCSIEDMLPLTGELSTAVNEEEGYIKLTFTSSDLFMGNMVLRRTDSKSGFLKWEDLLFRENQNDNPSFEYYDFTAESGLLYRYLVQRVDPRGRRGTPVYDQCTSTVYQGVSKPALYTMAEWEHAFLLESTGNGKLSGTKQLKLKFDFQISSYKTNISESKTDTIGSKYPFIRRNGNMYYRSFPITGIITEYMDEASLFVDKDTLFENHQDMYNMFKGQIDNYVNRYDYTYERKFREKVEQFLYNTKPKLYKSMQEGNIFIKLMQVSLTPKNELGRLIYTFSATAYEVDPATIDTYNSYGLISVGHFNPNVSSKKTTLAQISSYDSNGNIEGNMFKAGYDIIGTGSAPAANSIAKSIKYNEPINDKIVTDFTINWLRLTFESDPYLIIQQNGVFRPFDDIVDDNGSDNVDPPIDYPLYQIESTYNGDNVYLGWLTNINGEQIIVSPPNNIYELKEEDFSFKKNVQIIPAKDTAMLVDFRLVNVIEEDMSKVPKSIVIDKVNGQLVGTFAEDAELISRINYKYKYRYQNGADKVIRKVRGVSSVTVDTEPGAIVKLKTTAMNTPNRFVVNETGILEFEPASSDNGVNTYIDKLTIYGINIALKDTHQLGEVASLESIQYPIHNDSCIVNGVYYYYYKNKWQKAQLADGVSSLDVSVPVDALVFYFASVEEDTY